MRKLSIISFIIILLLFGISIYFYNLLPEKIITHWDQNGEPNGSMGKVFGVYIIPIATLVLFFLFLLIPLIDPLKENIKKFINYYDSFILVLVLFMFYIHILTLLWNIGYRFNTSHAFLPALGFLFIYIGIILKNVKRNWFIGVRTPWTLSSEKVWEKTHILGNKLFIISGIITIFGIFIPKLMIYFVLIPILISVLILFIYSYLVYRKEKK